jgi:multiple sugar transport system permease protein
MRMLERQNRTFWMFVLPAVTITLVCLLLPVGRGVQISLTNLDFLKNSNEFVGLANYARALSDPDFYRALGRNIVYVVIVVFFNFLIGFGMALVCYRRFAGERVVRTVLIFPMLLIPVAAATLWRFMYNYDMGVINKTLTSLGIGRVNWLGNPDLVLFSIIITDIWAWTPWMFLILLAGLEGISLEPIEAARIDGASGWKLVRYVILPLMSPVTRVAVSLKAIETFRTFDYVWVMSRGGPGSYSEIMSTFVYKQAYKNQAYGYSGAISFVVLILMVAVSFMVLRRIIMRGEDVN